MKGFTRKETRFSLCGLNCCLCSMHLGGYCPGCGGGAGPRCCGFPPGGGRPTENQSEAEQEIEEEVSPWQHPK